MEVQSIQQSDTAMSLTKPLQFACGLLLTLITLRIAYRSLVKYGKKTVGTSVNFEEQEHLEYPAVTLCAHTKPSFFSAVMNSSVSYDDLL